MALKGIWSIVQPLLPYMDEMVKMWVGWKVVTGGLALASLAGQIGTLSTSMGGLSLAMGGVAAAAGTIALAALAVTSIWAAGKSLITGKDNIFSQAAQGLGIVPKLTTDAEGRVTGTAEKQNAWISMWDRDPAAPPPNAREAQARRQQFYGRLDISGAPAGSKVETKKTGAPTFDVNMLGANP
jgi:hypothetical protein